VVISSTRSQGDGAATTATLASTKSLFGFGLNLHSVSHHGEDQMRKLDPKSYLQGLVDARLAIAEIEGEMSERHEAAFVKIRHRMNELIHEAAAGTKVVRP
jgi:hypothetical protein